MKINYIPDIEINLDNEDLLGNEPYVDTLSEIIKQSHTPFTIGLFGGWGIGKSSIIKTLKDNYNNDKKSGVEIFTYDAWKYLKDSFRRTFLLNFLEYFDLNTNEIQSRFYTNKVTNKTFGVSEIFKYQISNSISSDKTIEPEIFEGIFKESIQQVVNNKKFSWKFFKEFIGFKKKINKIVIVIDNIDRCHKDLAFELLLTIKNFLEQERVVFIIPIDETEIKKHLLNEGNDPNEFLRKLFNTTISIKNISESDLFNFANNLNNKYNLNFSPDILSIVAQQFSKNPRKIIQFLNVLQTEILLAKNQEKKGLIPEGKITKNLPFFTKLLIIREEWETLYNILKINSFVFADVFKSIKKSNEQYLLYGYKLNFEQINFLRRTNHITANHNDYELFFINKKSFGNIPDITNKFVESNDFENIKKQLNNNDIQFDELIRFIDEKFETALNRKELNTTIVNLISLIFKLTIDKSFGKQIKYYINNQSKFLGGLKNFISTYSMIEIVKFIDHKIIIEFIKENTTLSNYTLRNLIYNINGKEDNKQVVIDFVENFKTESKILKEISSKFSRYLSTDIEFANKVKYLLTEQNVYKNLIKPEKIDTFIKQVENEIDNENSNQKLELVYIYNNTVGLSKNQTEDIVKKLISFINSTNDYIKTAFWLDKLIQFIPAAKDNAVLSNIIFSSLSTKQTWMWLKYTSHWNNERYKNTLVILLTALTELYKTISNGNQKNQLITWVSQYYREDSLELVKFINSLFYNIINKFDVYNWPFAQTIINRYRHLSEWEIKKSTANTLNLMLYKTNNEEGLNEQQVQNIFTNYINSINETNKEEITKWISESLKNKNLIKHFEIIINNQSDEIKFEILKTIKN